MPELPDVEVFRGRGRRIYRRRIEQVAVRAARLLDGISGRALAERLDGRRFVASRRHGKHLFLRFDGGQWLVLHFGMTGALVPVPENAEEPKHTRMRIDFSDGSALAYTSIRKLGHIGLTEDVRGFVTERGLGIDALDRRFDRPTFEEILGKGDEGRALEKPIKGILMDQSRIAGIGNIYADEILYQARVHPLTPAKAMTPAQIRAVHRNIGRVLRTAIERSAGTEGFVERLPRSFLLRERKLDGRCRRCGGKIATFKLAGRTGYYCPRCQHRDSGRK